MKRTLIAVAAGILLLSGCSAASPPAPEPSADATEPAVERGPVNLSPEEAGERYLNIVCQGNFTDQVLWDAIKLQEEEYLNGGAPEIETTKTAATEVVRVDRQMIELVDDEYFVWPDGISEQLAHLRTQTMADLANNQSISNALTYEDAYYALASYPEASAEQQAAAQEIRYQLKLDADTTGSCAGFEAGNDELYAEMTERNALIEEQESEDE